MKFINTVLAVFSTRIIEKIIRQINSVIISRSLGPGGLGLYTLFFAVAKNLHTFSEFGLGASGIYIIRRKLSEEKKIIENSILFSIVVGILLSILVFIFKNQLGSFLLDDQSHFILLLSLVIPMIMIATIFSTLIRGMKKFKIFNLFTIIKPFCFLVFIFIGLVVYNGDLITAIIGQIVAILVSGFWIIYKMKILSSFSICFHKKLFYDSFKYGFKQHILKIIMMFLSTSPFYILKGLTNKEICEYLSLRKLKTLRTKKEYTPKLIWGTIQKYKNRLQRYKDKILFIRESLYVEKFRKDNKEQCGKSIKNFY